MNRVSRRSFFSIFGAGVAAGCGGGMGAPTIAAPVAQPATVNTSTHLHHPIIYQLFGPVHLQAAMSYPLPPDWRFPGSALTASTVPFSFDFGMLRARWACFRMIWTTDSPLVQARLVHADDGPQNITEMGLIEGRGEGPKVANNQTVDVTKRFNELVDARVYKNIGFQLAGDGLASFILWSARLEVVYEL